MHVHMYMYTGTYSDKAEQKRKQKGSEVNRNEYLEVPEVDDELVRTRAIFAAEEHGEVVLQPFRHVVGIKNSQLGRVSQALAAHHGNIHEADGQNEGGPPGGGRNGAEWDGGLLGSGKSPCRHYGVSGEEGGEMCLYTDRTHPRASPPVGDAEGLVEVEVAHVGADVARTRQTHLATREGATSAPGGIRSVLPFIP